MKRSLLLALALSAVFALPAAATDAEPQVLEVTLTEHGWTQAEISGPEHPTDQQKTHVVGPFLWIGDAYADDLFSIALNPAIGRYQVTIDAAGGVVMSALPAAVEPDPEPVEAAASSVGPVVRQPDVEPAAAPVRPVCADAAGIWTCQLVDVTLRIS